MSVSYSNCMCVSCSSVYQGVIRGCISALLIVRKVPTLDEASATYSKQSQKIMCRVMFQLSPVVLLLNS